MDDEEVQLFSDTDEYLVNQICVILDENGIPYIRKDDGSGAYMNLYMGKSMQEKRIFVNKQDYDKALELISFEKSNIENNSNESVMAKEKNTELDDYGKKYKLISKLLVVTVLILPVLVIILLMIATSLS